MAFPDSAGATVNVTNQVEPTPVQNNVTATMPADMTTTNLYGARIFGNGSDGDAIIPAGSNVTLTRDMQYANLTIEAGATLSSGGFKVAVAGTLLVLGKLHNEGFPGTPGAAPANNTYAAPGAGGLTGRYSGGGNGGAGGYGTSPTGASQGSPPPNYATADFINGGKGGDGGRSHNATAVAGGAISMWHPLVIADTTTLTTAKYTGGSGGAGGQYANTTGSFSATGNGGGGGGGGGTLVVMAKNINNSGIISVRGGNGGSMPALPTSGAGGGGGGGGGIAILVYATYIGNSVDISGGTAGTQHYVGTQPQLPVDGSAGRLAEIVVKA